MKLRPSPSPSPSKNKQTNKARGGSLKGSSSTSSMEPPKGCLRRFLLSPSSSSHNKATTFPSTKPIPTKAPISSKKAATTTKPTPSEAPISIPKTHPLLAPPPPSGSAYNPALSRGGDDDTSDNGGSGGRAMTPPIQQSVSPEIPSCGSIIISAATETPSAAADASPCYSAGHLLSGVADNRKCRPRGLLIFEEPPPPFDDGTNQPSSTLSSPIQASMRWLLSPCHEEGEHFLANSPFSDCTNAWCDLCSASSSSAKRRASTSPCDFVRHKTLLLPGPASFNYLVESPSKEEDKMRSPVSIGSLSSGNVIQTPLSDSGSERPIDIPRLSGSCNIQNRNFDAELDALVGPLQSTTVSHNSPVQLLDQEASSSFQFNCLTSPSCSLHHSQFQKVLDDKALWFSGSSSIDTTLPQTGVRISWREGLASRMFEMEEFDCCRCLSEDEDDCDDDLNNVSSESDSAPKLDAVGDQCSAAVLLDCGKQGKTEERFSSEVLPSCCAESINTDGGGLTRSDDSDWALCYKNHLFLD